MLQKHKEAISRAESKAYNAGEKAGLARGEELGRLYATQEMQVKRVHACHMAVLHNPFG